MWLFRFLFNSSYFLLLLFIKNYSLLLESETSESPNCNQLLYQFRKLYHFPWTLKIHYTYFFFKKKVKESEVAQSCPTLCDPIDCSLSGSSVHGFFQAMVLEWIAISFSRGSSQPRARTRVSCIVDRRFTVWATREVQKIWNYLKDLEFH